MENEQKSTPEDTTSATGQAEEQTSEAVDGGEKQSGETTGQSEGDLVKLLEDARSKADEHWDQLLRVRAEMENLKRRHERELENAHKFALDNFVRELLQVWDSLELGHSASQDETTNVEKLREGTELTLKLFGDVMSKFNVERIDPAGEPFDPERHQAMTMQPRDDMAPNHVATVVQKGYTLNGRLVRPALVIVSQSAN